MEGNDGRLFGRSRKEQKPDRGSLQTRFKDSWLGKNWGTIAILVAIILIALFVRSYFGFSTAVDNDYLLAGGSDSYYHLRVIEYVEGIPDPSTAGHHLIYDNLLNYPNEVRNMRPPVYDWSVAVTSMFMSGISGMSIHDSTGIVLLSSTAFWGAITCIPVFMLTRAAFGTRAGLLASLLFAIMAGNITRSVFADADHDAIVLFFVVFALYFLMRALQTINGTKWVSDWRQRKTIVPGIRSYIGTNKRSLIYAMLGGICISLVAMTWTGYTYILVIILVYFLVQVIINRFRNIDSMGEFFIIFAMLATAFVLMAPLYWQMIYWAQWFDVPFYLFAASMVVGGMFVVSRDYPWTLVLPAVIGIIVVGLVAIFFLSPSLFEAIISGQGYLVKNKLYSTISEAQAPTFSDLALSFGAVTFWFALIGVVWAAVKIPKNTSPYLVFIVVWLGVSIYMAASAARFMFNASPAFAMAAGWILALLIAKVHFEEVPKNFSGFFSHPWTTLKKAFKLRHVAVGLFLAFLIVLPNAWGALDAGIPSEIKTDYDRQIYYALPDILHPSDYDVVNGTYWYLGGFSYSLPLPSTYYPAAWSWFATQDTNTDISDRPAYLSWWDYGFEAIQEGKHPTVADNFQNGYQYAGSFLMSENESDAVSLFIIRILEKVGFNATTVGILTSNGIDAAEVQNIMQNPASYVQKVLDNPSVYGNFSSDLSPANAKYAAARIEIQKAGLENVVNAYHDLRQSSGYDIGYVAVDARLFPFSATSSNIFYAPAKLSDRAIDPTTNAPTNYFTIKAIVISATTGQYSVVDVSDVTSGDTVYGYQIYYTSTFYKTMIYRTMMGISPADIGQSSTYALPGISDVLKNYDAMPAFNLTHFKQVYRTAYYNPYNSSNLLGHSDAWRAISYEEALYRQQEINAGRDNGTVDLSSSSLQSGVVFIQYYDGAILSGKATSNDGTPYAGIYVTVVDEFGTPHQTVKTAADGSYTAYLPFGNVSVVYSAGTLGKGTNVATEIDHVNYTVSYAQAMRLEPFTASGDITLPGSTVSGKVFWDANGDGTYTAGEEYLSGATVTLKNNGTGFQSTVTTDSTGGYTIVGLAGDSNYLTATYNGHTFGGLTFNMVAYGSLTKNIALKPASINGTLTFSDGSAAPGVTLSLTDKSTGKVTNVTSTAGGKFLFSKLMPGEYTLTTVNAELSVGTQTYNLTAGTKLTPALKLFSASTVSGTVRINGETQANVVVEFVSPTKDVFATTDSSGHYSITLTQDTYTVYALSTKDGTDYVAMEQLVANGNTETLDLDLSAGAVVTGTVTNGGTAVSGASVIYTNTAQHTTIKATTNSTGGYRLVLPTGANYFVYAAGAGKASWFAIDVSSSMAQNIYLESNSGAVAGKVYYDADGDGVVDSGEALANAVVTVESTTAPDHKVTFLTSSSGDFNVSLPLGKSYKVTITKEGYSSKEYTYDPLNNYTSVNVPLIANERSVSGTVTVGGSDVSGVTVEFIPTGSSGARATATTDGSGGFTVSLKPGTYYVSINQNVTSGDDSRKYQYNSSLTVPVGRDPADLDIQATERVKVEGTVEMNSATGTIKFVGPDNRTIDAASTFTQYLAPGTYTIYVHLSSSGNHFANLTSVDISGPRSLNIGTEQARTVTGQLQYDGSDLKAVATITISNGSASNVVSSSSQGTFVTYLPAGTYTIGAEYHTTATVNGTTRYVVYTADQDVTVAGSDIEPNIVLGRELDKATLTGSISGSSGSTELTFTALDGTAMGDTTVGSGSYIIELAPGTYSVYAIEGSGDDRRVYLGVVTVGAMTTTTHDITLTTGIKVSGIVSYDGTPREGAHVIFSNNALVNVTTNSAGQYTAYLPAGLYNVSASWVNEEVSGVNVTYARSFDLNLSSGVTRNIDLVRQLKGMVDIVWDGVKKTVNAGESVTYDVTIVNRGNVDDTYKLTSNSTWGVTFSESVIHLGWGASSSKTIQVTIATPANAKVSHSAIKINAVSQNHTGASDSLNLDVNIAPTYGVAVSLGSAETTDGTTYTYPFKVVNNGNILDSFNFTLDPAVVADLQAKGWTVKISGTSNTYTTFSIVAGGSRTVNVLLTKTMDAPDGNISLPVTVKNNSGNQTATADVALVKGSFSVPDSGLTVSGNSITMTAPQIPGSTLVLVAMIALLFAAFIILRVNKGVFGRRRKR